MLSVVEGVLRPTTRETVTPFSVLGPLWRTWTCRTPPLFGPNSYPRKDIRRIGLGQDKRLRGEERYETVGSLPSKGVPPVSNDRFITTLSVSFVWFLPRTSWRHGSTQDGLFTLIDRIPCPLRLSPGRPSPLSYTSPLLLEPHKSSCPHETILTLKRVSYPSCPSSLSSSFLPSSVHYLPGSPVYLPESREGPGPLRCVATERLGPTDTSTLFLNSHDPDAPLTWTSGVWAYSGYESSTG